MIEKIVRVVSWPVLMTVSLYQYSSVLLIPSPSYSKHSAFSSHTVVQFYDSPEQFVDCIPQNSGSKSMSGRLDLLVISIKIIDMAIVSGNVSAVLI